MTRSDEVARAVAGFRRNVALRYGTARVLELISWWGFVWGTGALAWRALGGALPSVLVLGGIGLAAAGFLGVRQGLRRRPATRVVEALLDQRGALGGLLLARAEAEAAGWASRRDALAPLRLVWRPGRTLLTALAALLFAGAALLVPVGPILGGGVDRLEIGGLIDQVAADLSWIEERGLLEEERAEELAREAERLREEASGEDPAAAWAALDHLREEFERALAEGAERAEAQRTAVEAALAVAEALPEVAGQDPGLAAEAMAELVELAASIAGEVGPDTGLADGLGDFGDFDEGGLLTPEQLGSLLADLAARRSELDATLAELRVIDGFEAVEVSDQPGEAADAALLAYLDREGLDAAAGVCRFGRTGIGAISRGPGHVEMTWNDPSSQEGVSFRAEELPPAVRLDRSQRIALERVAPEGLEAGEESAGLALVGAATGGGAAQTSVVLPRHRGTVKRYFDRGEGGSSDER